MSYPPYFHADSDAVRFWVEINGAPVGASISQRTLHHRYHPKRTDDEPLATYLANTAEIHAAVMRRVASGSIEPVMLRELDVQAPIS